MGKIWSNEKQRTLLQIRRMIGALIGVTIYAISINIFMVPSKLYSGGIMGICQIFRTIMIDYLKLPVQNFDITGIIYYVLNVPIFILAISRIGKRFFAKTLICVTWMSIMLSVIPIPKAPILSEDILATCLIGGIVCGFGTGLTLKMGSSSGGMDIIGILLIKWRKNFSVGQVNLVVNAVLYGICLFLFDIPTVIYSLIFAAVTSVAVDRVHAQNINVEVQVITKKACKEMEDEIFNDLGRGITKWSSKGAYTEEESAVLYILLSKYEVGHLKHIVKKYDPQAFLVVNEGVTVEGNYLKKL